MIPSPFFAKNNSCEILCTWRVCSLEDQNSFYSFWSVVGCLIERRQLYIFWVYFVVIVLYHFKDSDLRLLCYNMLLYSNCLLINESLFLFGVNPLFTVNLCVILNWGPSCGRWWSGSKLWLLYAELNISLERSSIVWRNSKVSMSKFWLEFYISLNSLTWMKLSAVFWQALEQ